MGYLLYAHCSQVYFSDEQKPVSEHQEEQQKFIGRSGPGLTLHKKKQIDAKNKMDGGKA